MGRTRAVRAADIRGASHVLPFVAPTSGTRWLAYTLRGASSSTAEQRTLNPQVPGSNPGGRTGESRRPRSCSLSWRATSGTGAVCMPSLLAASRFSSVSSIINVVLEVRPNHVREESDEDARLWLGYPLSTGNDGAVKPTQERKSLKAERIRFRFHVGERVARQLGLCHGPEDHHRSGVDTADHLLAATRPGPDQLGKLGVPAGELSAGRHGRGTPRSCGACHDGEQDLLEEPPYSISASSAISFR